MFARWLNNLKWALVIAIFAGPAFAGWTYFEQQKYNQVMAQGTEATALVDGGEMRSGRRGSRTYTIHAVWAEAGGAQHAEDLKITSNFANQIIQDDLLMIDAVHVKYVPGNAELPTVVLEDETFQREDQQMMMVLGGGAGVIGLIGSALFFLFGRKKKEPESEAAPA